jgi:hypothetical protein
LRRNGGLPDDGGKRRDNCRNDESHDYEKGFLDSELQAVSSVQQVRCKQGLGGPVLGGCLSFPQL